MKDKIKLCFFLFTLVSMSFIIDETYSYSLYSKEGKRIGKIKEEYFKIRVLLGCILLLFLYYEIYFNK